MTALAIGFDVPFDEAIKAAVTRGVVLPDVYYGELQGVAHQLAFSIAGIAAYDQLQAVRDSLASAIADGKSFREWKRTIPSELFELPNYRLENIWRTNLQGNYMRGRWERFTRFAKNRPFLMYDAINDTRVRPSHLAHDGVIRAVHDRFWATHSPPLGYNCRCTLVSLTEAQAQARSGPGKGLYQIPEHADGKPAMPDPGWDFNPFEDRMRFIDGQIRKREADPKSNRKLVSSLQGLKPPKPWLDDAAGRWHDAACQNAPEWLTRNFSKHASPDVWQTRGASAYCRWEKELEMGDTRMDTPGGQNTWRHEFGHWLDGKMRTNNGGRFYRSEAPDFVHAMKEDAMLARGKVGAGTRAANVRAKLDALYLEGRETMERMAFDKEWIITHLEDRYRALGLEISDALDALAEEMPVAFMGRAVHDVFIATMLNGIAIAMENSDAHGFCETFARDNRYVYKDMIGGKLHSLSDLIGSATLNGVLGIKHAGIGHSDAYYKKSSAKAGTECFANLTALYGAGHPFWSKVAERFAPGMSKLYNTIMKQ